MSLRPLRFHHYLVLAEDGVFEVLQDALGLLQIVVPADDHVPGTAVRATRLRGEEIHHPVRPAPAEPQDDGVRRSSYGGPDWSFPNTGKSSLFGASGLTIA